MLEQLCGNLISSYETAKGLTPYLNIEKPLNIDEAIPNVVHYMNYAIVEKAHQQGIRTFYTGLGGDFWVSAKGKSVVYTLFNSGQWKEALRICKEISAAENTSFGKAFRKNHLVFLPVSRRYYRWRVPWNKETGLQKQFVGNSIKEPIESMLHMPELINQGRFSRMMQKLDNRHEHYGMSSANPFFDRRLMEFMADVPLSLYVQNGKRRALFRKAMMNVLPPEILQRDNKRPYVVDYLNRINLEESRQILGKEFDFMFENFLDRSTVTKLFAHEFNPVNKHQKESIRHRIKFLVVSALALKLLQEKGYLFVN